KGLVVAPSRRGVSERSGIRHAIELGLDSQPAPDRVNASEDEKPGAEPPCESAASLRVGYSFPGLRYRGENTARIDGPEVPRSVEVSAQEIHHALGQIPHVRTARRRKWQHRKTA